MDTFLAGWRKDWSHWIPLVVQERIGKKKDEVQQMVKSTGWGTPELGKGC